MKSGSENKDQTLRNSTIALS